VEAQAATEVAKSIAVRLTAIHLREFRFKQRFSVLGHFSVPEPFE
jgi:hypothetical protein